MKTLLTVALVIGFAGIASAEPFVVIVRHAEKTNNSDTDPDLSTAGLARADALAQMLKDAGIKSIFTSEFKRTAETAAPTAKALNVRPMVVPADNGAALVGELRQLKANALVVGHGNTIPDLLKALGMDTSAKIAEDDYSQIFVVVLGEKPQLLRLRYPPVGHG